MSRRYRWFRIGLGVALAAGGALSLARGKPAERRTLLADACHTPARVIEPPPGAGAASGAAVIFHGLAATAAVMEPIGQALSADGWRVYLLDLAGHGRSTTPFSYASVETCAAGAVASLARTGAIQPGTTILLGHSLGGAVAVRLAARFPVAATVAISPALLALPRRAPPNLLVLTGQFDFGTVKRTASELVNLAGGVREGASDFSVRRAANERSITGAFHGPMVLDPRVWRLAVDWARRARAGPAAGPANTRPTSAGTPHRLASPASNLLATLALVAGLALLVAPLETLLARACRIRSPQAEPVPLAWNQAIGRWILASFLSVSSLGLARVAAWLHPVRLEGGDWAGLVALVTGLALLGLGGERLRPAAAPAPSALLAAALSGLLVLGGFAAALAPEVAETTASPERLWRFVVLIALTWPYFTAEEAALGPPGGWERIGLFFTLRAVVWLAQVFAVLVFWNWGLLMVLLALGLAAVTVGQRLAADALRRRGAGVPTAALLDAILAAGMLALVLPLT